MSEALLLTHMHAQPQIRSVESESAVDLSPFLSGALPTRSRPQGLIDGPGAWLDFRLELEKTLSGMRQATESQSLPKAYREPYQELLAWFADFCPDSEPHWLDTQEALNLTTQVLIVMSWVHDPQGVAPYMYWLATKVAPETFVEAARLPLELIGHDKLLFTSALGDATQALRAALVKTGEPYYARVLALCQRACALDQQPDFQWMVHFAFLLADDRPAAHPLQPLAVIEAMEALESGEEQASLLIPLILEAPPQKVEAPRARMNYGECLFLYSTENELQAAETALAAAVQFGQSAFPAVKWAMGAFSGQFAPMLVAMALDERENFSSLLPYLHFKQTLLELDKASAKHREQVFRKILQPVIAGSEDAHLLMRVKETICGHSYEELARWVGGDSPALNAIERVRAAIHQPLAALENCPPPLRDPPWERRRLSPGAQILDLEPIPTPFAFTQGSALAGQSQRDRKPYCPPVGEMIRAVLHCADCDAPFNPDVSSLGMEPGIEASIQASIQASNDPGEVELFFKRIGWSVGFIKRYYEKIFLSLFGASHREDSALLFLLWKDCPGYWNMGELRPVVFRAVMQEMGERAMPALVKLFSWAPENAFDLIENIDSSSIAPQAALGLLNLKKTRERSMAPLTKYRRTAISSLIPDALRAQGAAREAASNALRWMATQTEGGRQELDAAAAVYAKEEHRVNAALEAAIKAALNTDPLNLHPFKIPMLPSWFDPASLRRPELKSGGALPDRAVIALAQMLAFTDREAPYAGIDRVRQATTPQSLAAFSWDLFSAWLAHGSPPKDIWAMHALGWLGDDECARKLARLIRKWPGESANARALSGLDALSDIGSETALVLLASIAEKVKYKPLQDRAKERIERIAQTRGLSPQELSDRIVPDLDLDERGGLDLNFGARRFRVGFDQFLRPSIRDATGQLLNDLPKPNKSDDPELARKATERFKALKHDAKAIAGLQITRLENMLVEQRRVAPEVFWARFASHPLVRHLACRLLWGEYPDDDPRSTPVSAFRVTEELSLADQNDDPIAMDFGATAQGRIGLVHPMNPPVGGLEGWSHLFADYKIAPPFLQLARERFALTEDEKGSAAIQRFAGSKVEGRRVRSLISYGWRLGEPMVGGGIVWVEKKVRAGDAMLIASIEFTSGSLDPAGRDDDAPIIGNLTLERARSSAQGSAIPFSELDAVTASEILGGPALLFLGVGKK